jgi:VIT1/CCC1 family predicted Fe2+/Mn2+ transporter
MRSLDDIDVREEESEEGVAHGGRIEVATFTEGEYVESILIDRARATEVYRNLGKILGNRITSERETATILAALRYWQREGSLSAGHERDIETDFDRLKPLSAEEIDALGERINCGDHDRRTS